MKPTEAIAKLDASDIADVIREMIEDSKIGRRWRKDSSLEEWFPFTAEELEKLRISNFSKDRCIDELLGVLRAGLEICQGKGWRTPDVESLFRHALEKYEVPLH